MNPFSSGQLDSLLTSILTFKDFQTLMHIRSNIYLSEIIFIKEGDHNLFAYSRIKALCLPVFQKVVSCPMILDVN